MSSLHIDSSFTKCIDQCTTGQLIIPKGFQIQEERNISKENSSTQKSKPNTK
jgi:hypothetical protein